MSLNRRLANLGNVIDSATTGHFLSKGDSDGQFSTVAYSSIVGTPTVLDSALTSQLVDSSYVQLRQTTSAAGLDSALITTLVDSSYVAARAGSGGGGSGFVKYQYTATQGQTTFQDSASSGATLSYSEDYILVHYNGVALPASDYTASSGSSVVLGTGADSGAIVSIAKWSAPSSGGGAAAVWYGDRAVVTIGHNGSSTTNTINYFDITSTGNASDFGDLTESRQYMGGVSNGTRGVFIGGASSSTTIDYVTIASPGNATDFGDTGSGDLVYSDASNGTYGVFNIATTRLEYITIATAGNASTFGNPSVERNTGAGASDGTYGVFAGGYGGGDNQNTIDYVTIASPGNATDFGDLQTAKSNVAGTGLNGQGVWGGGYNNPTYYATIEYVAIDTPGNASTWGNLTSSRRTFCATTNETRAVFCGGNTGSSVNTIDYITTGSTGNATDFGDLTSVSIAGSGACSGSPS